MIFLNALFGYLCIAIVYKWISGKVTDLYHVMIYMFLSPGAIIHDSSGVSVAFVRVRGVCVIHVCMCTERRLRGLGTHPNRARGASPPPSPPPSPGTVDESGFLFSGQAGLQVLLLLVAFVAVPWMLVPKPMILKKRHEASARAVGSSRSAGAGPLGPRRAGGALHARATETHGRSLQHHRQPQATPKIEPRPTANRKRPQPQRSAYDSMDGHHDDEEARGLMHGQAQSSGHGGGGHGHGDHFDFGEVRPPAPVL